MSSRKQPLLTNALANWLGFAVNLVVAFFLFPLLVHGLGERRYGIWWLVESILAYLMLFDLGVAAAVVRYVAHFEATDDQESLNRVFSTSICIFSIAGGLVLALALFLAFPGLSLLSVPDDLVVEYRWLLVLLGFNLAAGLPLNVFPCVLDGLGRFPSKTAVRTVTLLVRSVLFVVVIESGGGLVELGLAVTGCNLVEHLGLAVAAHLYLPGLRFSLRLADWATFRSIRGYSLDAFLAMLAGRVCCQTDALVINAFLGPKFITIFAVAGRLVEYVKGSLRAATTVLTPAVSVLETRGDNQAIRQVLLDSTRLLLWLILPVQVGLLLLGKPFLTLWVGEEHAKQSYLTLVILTLPLGLALSQLGSGRILYGTGKLHWFARLALLEAVANLVLSIVLVVPLGVEGVAIGTSVPSAIASVALLVYVCRQVGVGVGEYLRRSFLTPCLLAALLTAAWWWMVALAPPVGWGSLVAISMSGLAGFGVVALLVELGPQAVLRHVRNALAAVGRRQPPGGGKQSPGGRSWQTKRSEPQRRLPAADCRLPTAFEGRGTS
jgi:O-antigen/teichoic acid export membrane protein